MKAKQIIRCIIFLSLVAVMVGCLCRLFKVDNDWISERFVTYRSLKKGEMDGIYVGSSAVDRYWNCAQGFEEYGLTVYPIASDGAPAWATRYMIEEALRYQNPKLVIIDIRSFAINVRLDSFKTMSKIADVLPFYSIPRWKIVAKTEDIMYHTEDSGFDKPFDINYYLSIGQFHNKWEDDTFSLTQFQEVPSDTLGFYAQKNSVRTLSKKDVKKMKKYSPSEEYQDLEPVMEEALLDLMEYLKKQPFEVLFIDSPHVMNNRADARINTIGKMVREQGFDFIQIVGTDMGEYSLDPKTDYYNLKHVNYEGSVKYTRYLSEYLLKSYDFWTDHRNDPDTKDFDGVLDHIKEKVRSLREEQA